MVNQYTCIRIVAQVEPMHTRYLTLTQIRLSHKRRIADVFTHLTLFTYKPTCRPTSGLEGLEQSICKSSKAIAIKFLYFRHNIKFIFQISEKICTKKKRGHSYSRKED